MPELEEIGGDLVVVDSPDVSERIKAAVGHAELRLALDSVSGPLQPHQEHAADAGIRAGVDRCRRRLRHCARTFFGVRGTRELDRG